MMGQNVIGSVVLLGLALFPCRAASEPKPYCRIIQVGTLGAPSLLEPISTTGVQKLIYFRARFPDDKQDPISLQDAEATLAEVNELFTRISYGKFSLDWKVSPVLQLSKSREEYNGPGGFAKFLDDVRQAALDVGEDYREYDLDVVRHSGVPDFAGGNANLGSRGAQVQASGAAILVHELGHNLGLSHANLWTTGSPGLSSGSPPLPSNYEAFPDPRSIPVYPDSALGHETITGPGYSAEYGDTWDIMGSGTFEFSTLYRHQLGWLSPSEIIDAPSGASTNRIQGADGNIDNPPVPRAIRVGRPFASPSGQRQYWVQIAPPPNQSDPIQGVHLRWADASSNWAGSLLLAPSASTADVDGGTLLSVGQTFSDSLAGIHITVIACGGHRESGWADVATFNGDSANNRPPAVSLSASPAAVEIGQPVLFSAVAADSDADPLVWRWNFGDHTASTIPSAVSKSWRREGDFVVTLEVSDLRGGVARAHLAVRVGQPNTRRITGRVLDRDGHPVLGVRVHNGVVPGTDGLRLISTLTDSLGGFTLTGLVPGTYTNGAFRFGQSIARRAPVTVTDQDVNGVDFIAIALPEVSVTAAAHVPESIGLTNLFAFTRSGPTDKPLTVVYQVGGSAIPGRDYARPLVDRIVIPAGARTAPLLLNIFDDEAPEPEETITVDVNYPSTDQRQDGQGDLFNVYFPGWELVEMDGRLNWVLTEPAYVPGVGRSAAVMLEDDDVAKPHLVTITADTIHAIEEPRVNSSFVLTRTGEVNKPLTVHLSATGSAESGIDYVALPVEVTFAPGETEIILSVEPLTDNVPEGDEQIALTVAPKPEYGIEVGTATLTIRDSAAVPQTLTAKLLLDGTLQLTMKGQPGSRLVLETSDWPIQWEPIRTNLLFNSDTATFVLPARNRPRALFRTVRAAPHNAEP